MKASEIMTKDPMVATEASTIQEVSDLLYATSLHHLPVVDHTGRLVGIISDRDLRTYLVPRDIAVSDPAFQDRLKEPVAQIIRHNVVSVYPDTEVPKVIECMLMENIGAVPVISKETQKILGMVSYIDILRVAISYL